MATTENKETERHSLSARKTLLLVFIVGLGAGVVAYSVGDTLAANAAQSALATQSTNGAYPTFGPRGWEGRYNQYSLNHTGTRLSFRAISTVSNVSITGFNIVDGTHVSVSLAWTGSGSAPALTLVGAAIL